PSQAWTGGATRVYIAGILVGAFFFFFQAEDGIRDFHVTGVQTCALPICPPRSPVQEEAMGRLALAAKITHVPSMYLSEQPGPHQGCRQAAIDGHHEIGRRCRALHVDTIVVLDTHWLVNAGYHVNCRPRFTGDYTSNELPHFIRFI